jgi:hypothetical protein
MLDKNKYMDIIKYLRNLEILDTVDIFNKYQIVKTREEDSYVYWLFENYIPIERYTLTLDDAIHILSEYIANQRK